MQTAPQIAQGAVALVKKKFGFQLNYDPPSLIVIDMLIDKIKETGASEHQASGFLLGLGCYVGEVFVRHARASWRETAQMGMTKTCAYPIILALPGTRGLRRHRHRLPPVHHRARGERGAAVGIDRAAAAREGRGRMKDKVMVGPGDVPQGEPGDPARRSPSPTRARTRSSPGASASSRSRERSSCSSAREDARGWA